MKMGSQFRNSGMIKMSMSSSEFSMGHNLKKNSFLSGTDYANVRPTRSNVSNISMSIGG